MVREEVHQELLDNLEANLSEAVKEVRITTEIKQIDALATSNVSCIRGRLELLSGRQHLMRG